MKQRLRCVLPFGKTGRPLGDVEREVSSLTSENTSGTFRRYVYSFAVYCIKNFLPHYGFSIMSF